MARRRTEKSCYQSAYGGGWVTASRRLAEMACTRIAGEESLSVEFWKLDQWAKIFSREVMHAARLLAVPFSFQAIAAALGPREGRNVTLGAPFLREHIAREQTKLDIQAQRLETGPVPDNIDTFQTPRPVTRHGKSIREKLEEDGEGKQGNLF